MNLGNSCFFSVPLWLGQYISPPDVPEGTDPMFHMRDTLNKLHVNRTFCPKS